MGRAKPWSATVNSSCGRVNHQSLETLPVVRMWGKVILTSVPMTTRSVSGPRVVRRTCEVPREDTDSDCVIVGLHSNTRDGGRGARIRGRTVVGDALQLDKRNARKCHCDSHDILGGQGTEVNDMRAGRTIQGGRRAIKSRGHDWSMTQLDIVGALSDCWTDADEADDMRHTGSNPRDPTKQA